MDQQTTPTEQPPKEQNTNKPKLGYVIDIIGRQGSGKTVVIKREAQESGFDNIVAYDPRKEYNEESNYPISASVFYSLIAFKNFCKTAKNCFIICEEATGFVNSFKDMEFTDFLIAVQHNCNVIAFVFHSLSDTPAYILRLSRFVILLKTNDEPEVIKTARPKFYPFLLQSRETGEDIYIDVNEI